MTTPPSDAELRAALALAEKATPEPWEACTWDLMERPHVTTILTSRECMGRYDAPRTKEDAAFIAAARTGWPAAAEALLATRAALRDLLLSADASWEEHDTQGHDWAEMCHRARALLGEPPPWSVAP